MGDGEGEDGRVAVGVNFKHFFFYFLVVLFDSFAKEDRFICFFNVVFPRRPEVERAHAGYDINTPREPFLEKMPSDVLGLFPRLTRDVDENHTEFGIESFFP